MAKTYEHKFPETGSRLRFEPEHRLFFIDFAKGPFDMTVVQQELGYGMLLLKHYEKLSRFRPLHILVCAKYIAPRSSVSFRVATRVVRLLHKKWVGKTALFGGGSVAHSLAGALRIMTGKEVRHFDTEAQARRWLASNI